MKPFRGTLLALLALLVVGGAYMVLRPEVKPSSSEDEDCNRLFEFEKHELTRVYIDQPGADGVKIGFSESDDGDWYIEGDDEVADRSMVNRAKHQIHDLCSRAILEDPDALEKYGLGSLAAEVTLTLRGDRTVKFRVGDPNPTNVSYYIQPDGDSAVYTVKKSASDFWFSELAAFRERRFARFDSKDAIALRAKLGPPEARYSLDFEQIGERDWIMTEPMKMSAHVEEIRRLLGRVQALKAKELFDVPADEMVAKMAEYGLDEPRADIEISFASRDPLRVLIGDEAESSDERTPLAYMMVAGDDTIQVARFGLLEDFAKEPAGFRNRRVVRMAVEDVNAIDVEMFSSSEDELKGRASVRYAAEQWLWEDGTNFPGSGAERVASRFSELEIESIVVDTTDDLAAYGLDNPRAEVRLTNREGEVKVILIGGRDEPEVIAGPEGEEVHERRFLQVVDDAHVYRISENMVIGVLEDVVRQRGKKSVRDEERAANRERIPSELREEDLEDTP
ncbi:MAG: hypothetical protein ACI8S6_005050 [Myxococcota bacterium]|jgi:hypothetical protein